MKTIAIFSKLDMFDYQDDKIPGYKVYLTELFREDIPKLLVKGIRKTGLYGTKLMLKNRDSIDMFDVAIIPDVQITYNVVKALTLQPVANRQIIYYQNKITKADLKIIRTAKASGFSVYTYNLHDAREYNLQYNSQFWNTKYLNEINAADKMNPVDVFFCGQEKGRYRSIMQLKEELLKLGKKVLFIIVSNNKLPATQKEYVPYDEYIKMLAKSKVVVDLVNEDNKGLTVRPLEALFSKKKLITNYRQIVEYNFYMKNKENIFILDKDEDIESFIEKPFVDNDFDMNYYSFPAWVQRFTSS